MKNEYQFHFDPLFAFSEGDEEAAREILVTFIQETEKNIGCIEQALAAQDFKRLCEIGHKMLPTFTMLQAGESVQALQWLESKRNQAISYEETHEKVEIVLRYARAVVKEAQQRCIKK